MDNALWWWTVGQLFAILVKYLFLRISYYVFLWTASFTVSITERLDPIDCHYTNIHTLDYNNMYCHILHYPDNFHIVTLVAILLNNKRMCIKCGFVIMYLSFFFYNVRCCWFITFNKIGLTMTSIGLIPVNTKHLYKHLYNVGPMSKTLARRCINVIEMFCVCWDIYH